MTTELTVEYVAEVLESSGYDRDLWVLTWYWSEYGDRSGVLAKLFPELVEEGIERIFTVEYEAYRGEGWARLEYKGETVYEASYNKRDC